MAADEAIDLIVLALDRATPGAVVVPQARAMTILDVAKAATSDDVEVEIIGERPGEKMHEMLIHYEESVRAVIEHDPFHFQLVPPGQRVGEEAFTLASHSPNHWMPIDEMRELIADAEEV
jgi:UDP-N-acetylglucosamine 4,6-dehydratase